ncbi:MAG: MFS transporter [Candidatus Marinimicrobia bacterium]|nr:MFS transporter [Candidatus Neomarinimicrobiota bacterium]
MNKKILWSAYFGILIFGMAMLSLGTVNNYLTLDQKLSQLTIASLATLLPVGILLGSMVFGPVVDRFGYKIVLAICTGLIAVSFVTISLTAKLFWLQLSFFLIGFGGGAINGGTSALVADISETAKGAGLSLLGVFYGLGALGMPLLNGLLSKQLSNQQILLFFAVLSFLPVIYFLCIRFPEPKHKQGFPITQGLKLFRDPMILLIGFFLFFESGIEGITNNWTTTFLRDGAGISPEKALYALSMMVLALTITRLILGSLLKKIPAWKILFLSLGFILAGSLALAFFPSLLGAFIGLGLLGIGFAAGFPTMLGYVGEFYAGFSGTAFSVVLFIALIGNTIINYLVGLFANSGNIRAFPWVIALSTVAMASLLLMTTKSMKSKIKE